MVRSSELNIAVVGATGAVGRALLELLEQRNHPIERIAALASSRSVGKTLPYLDGAVSIEDASSHSFTEADVAFISVNSAVSLQLAPLAVKAGTLVIDDGNAFRMDAKVPLIVPEINGREVEWHSGIISIPNCTTTPLAMVLDALRAASDIDRVTVATYQAVSGTGSAAVEELQRLSRTALDSGGALSHKYPDCSDIAPAEVYPHSIAFNVIPQVEDFKPDGYSVEEHKMVNETRKILGLADLRISSTCVRVPVYRTHSEAVHIDFKETVTPHRARELLANYPGVEVEDDPSNSVYPMPSMATGRSQVFVGRIRQDISNPSGLVLWLACDNLLKGAAFNALQIFDEVVRRGVLRKKNQKMN
jgi:aspartate-semialdehyde dehydrogenase